MIEQTPSLKAGASEVGRRHRSLLMAAAAAVQEEKIKKKSHQWKRAIIHSSFFFLLGFFSGFAPATIAEWSPSPSPIKPLTAAASASKLLDVSNRSLLARLGSDEAAVTAGVDAGSSVGDDDLPESNPRRLAIVVTTTAAHRERVARETALTRMALTLRLAPPPVVWIVVEAHADVPATAKLLRATGVMYRHLAYKENFTDNGVEEHHQRNVALGHVERHRLSGVVVFAALDGVYDLQLFQEIRGIEAFGAWPVASVSPATSGGVTVDVPTCSASRVTGRTSTSRNAAADAEKPRRANIYGFGFSSSVLWDPDRWARPTSEPDTSQDSTEFVRDAAAQDESRVKGLPSDCSQVMVWRLESLPPPAQSRRRRR